MITPKQPDWGPGATPQSFSSGSRRPVSNRVAGTSGYGHGGRRSDRPDGLGRCLATANVRPAAGQHRATRPIMVASPCTRYYCPSRRDMSSTVVEAVCVGSAIYTAGTRYGGRRWEDRPPVGWTILSVVPATEMATGIQTPRNTKPQRGGPISPSWSAVVPPRVPTIGPPRWGSQGARRNSAPGRRCAGPGLA